MRVYIAGPEVFLPNAVDVGENKKAICAKYGLVGVYPLDSGADLSGGDQALIAYRISAANEGLIQGCDILIANMTPFRGPSADVGTAYEMGYARGHGLQVLAYTNEEDLFTARTLSFLGDAAKPAQVFGVPGFVDGEGMAVESFAGLWDNLMLDGAVTGSGSRIVSRIPLLTPRCSNLGGFEACVVEAVRVLGV